MHVLWVHVSTQLKLDGPDFRVTECVGAPCCPWCACCAVVQHSGPASSVLCCVQFSAAVCPCVVGTSCHLLRVWLGVCPGTLVPQLLSDAVLEHLAALLQEELMELVLTTEQWVGCWVSVRGRPVPVCSCSSPPTL